MSDADRLSFAADIRGMFTDLDVAHMRSSGMDLSNYNDVKANADAIYSVVTDGTMPPKNSGEPKWTTEMCDRFKRWQDGGCLP